MPWRTKTGPVATRALPGRQRERELFAEALSSAAAGDPRILLFEGEEASGKTSLLEEIAISPLLPRRRIRVAFIALREGEVVDAVGQAARAVTRLGVYDRLGGRRRTLGMLGRLAPEWAGAVPGWGDLLEAILRTSEAVRRRRRAALPGEQIAEEIEQILDVARRRPVALLFDNLELADDSATERLRRLVRHADIGTRLLIIGAFRASPPGADRAAIRSLVERLPAGKVVHHRLGALAAADVDEWLISRLDGQPPPGLRDWLLVETGGQPGALNAALDALLEDGSLARPDGAWLFSTADRTRHTAGPQLDLSRLGEKAADAVRAASVLGDSFAGDELAQLLGVDELELEDRLSVAVRFGLLEVTGTVDRPDGDFATAYRFVSSSARAVLHRTLLPQTRAKLQEALDARGHVLDSYGGRNGSAETQSST